MDAFSDELLLPMFGWNLFICLVNLLIFCQIACLFWRLRAAFACFVLRFAFFFPRITHRFTGSSRFFRFFLSFFTPLLSSWFLALNAQRRASGNPKKVFFYCIKTFWPGGDFTSRNEAQKRSTLPSATHTHTHSPTHHQSHTNTYRNTHRYTHTNTQTVNCSRNLFLYMNAIIVINELLLASITLSGH